MEGGGAACLCAELPQFTEGSHLGLLVALVSTHVLYSHPRLLLLDGTTSRSAWGFLIMSRQWMVSAWHRKMFWSTYTPPFRISAKRERNEHIARDIQHMYMMAENQYFKVKSSAASLLQEVFPEVHLSVKINAIDMRAVIQSQIQRQ